MLRISGQGPSGDNDECTHTHGSKALIPPRRALTHDFESTCHGMVLICCVVLDAAVEKITWLPGAIRIHTQHHPPRSDKGSLRTTYEYLIRQNNDDFSNDCAEDTSGRGTCMSLQHHLCDSRAQRQKAYLVYHPYLRQKGDVFSIRMSKLLCCCY